MRTRDLRVGQKGRNCAGVRGKPVKRDEPALELLKSGPARRAQMERDSGVTLVLPVQAANKLALYALVLPPAASHRLTSSAVGFGDE